MTMLANRDEGRVLTLADYEARIHLYREQIGTGYIGIGRTLNEAKEAKVVPHGQWETWVTETTGLTPRQAQRCMQAATEIREGSAMARLEMSKALMLLGSGLEADEQERIAETAAEDGATVKALKEEIRQAKLKLAQESGAAGEIRAKLRESERKAAELTTQMQALHQGMQARLDEETTRAYQRGSQDTRTEIESEIRKEFQEKIDYINGERYKLSQEQETLQQALAQARKDASRSWDEGFERGKEEAGRDDTRAKALQNELNKQEQYNRELQRDREDLLEAAEEAEKRAARAEAELEALKACGPETEEPAWKIIQTATDRFRADCEMLPIHDAAGILRGEGQIGQCLSWLETWIACVRDTMAGVVVTSEGAVE